MQKKYISLFLLSFMLGLAACQPNKMNEKEAKYKDVVVKVNQAIDNGNVDALDNLITENAIDHQMDTSLSKKPGLAGIKEMLGMYHKIIPDMKTSIHSIAVSGDTAFAYFTSTGTPTKPFMGMPANIQITTNGVDVMRFEGNKIAEHWGFMDVNDMMKMMHSQKQPDMPMMMRKK
jgi:predicted ester cyclase